MCKIHLLNTIHNLYYYQELMREEVSVTLLYGVCWGAHPSLAATHTGSMPSKVARTMCSVGLRHS